MDKPIRDQGLLEYLASRTGCLYISDLYQAASLPAVKKVISDMDIDMYTFKQWDEAAGYISKKKLCFESKEEVIAFLQQL